VVGATAPIAHDLGARLGADAHWVSNGFDPVGVTPVDPPFSPQAGWATIAHTGTLSGLRGRDPRPFIRALRAFNAARADGETRVRLLLAGRSSVEDEQLLAEADLGDAVEHVGLLGQSAVLALQRHADALLLLTGTDRSEATGKLFEYLAAGRPIVALAHGNEAARIVAETCTGRVVDGGDQAAITAALAALADGRLDADYAPVGLERFRYPAPAEAMAQLVDRAIAQSGLSSRT
jgi:glycosyltransferase involved in cell wall biosynthesis